MNKKWNGFKKKYLGKVEKGFFWLIDILGLMLAIISFRNNQISWKLLLGIIVTNSILIAIAASYESYTLIKGRKLIYDFQRNVNSNKKIKNDLLFYYDYVIGSLNKYSTNLLLKNTDLNFALDKIKAIQIKAMDEDTKNDLDKYEKIKAEAEDKIERLLNSNNYDKNIEEDLQDLKKITCYDYHQAMRTEYQRYLSEVIGKIKEIIDTLLKEKGLSLEVKVTIKQFNRIVTDYNNIDDVKIITTFRDAQTYNKNKTHNKDRQFREIGSEKYIIHENSAFEHCLNDLVYLHNNVDKNNYRNKHKGYEEFYNCVLVVPIICQYPESKHYFGYLACDTLNNDKTNNDIFDNDMSTVLATSGRIIGMYFDNLDFQWESVLGRNCLEALYDMTIEANKYKEGKRRQ